MIFDGNLLFDAASYNPANGLQGVNQFASGATTTSTNVLDMLNARDMGQAKSGKAPLEIFVLITTAYTGGTSVNFQLQGSTDNVTYTVYAESGAIPVASLTVGAQVFNVMLPGVQPEAGVLPRYYRMAYVNVGANTTGAVISGLLSTDDNRYYRPGIVVSN